MFVSLVSRNDAWLPVNAGLSLAEPDFPALVQALPGLQGRCLVQDLSIRPIACSSRLSLQVPRTRRTRKRLWKGNGRSRCGAHVGALHRNSGFPFLFLQGFPFFAFIFEHTIFSFLTGSLSGGLEASFTACAIYSLRAGGIEAAFQTGS